MSEEIGTWKTGVHTELIIVVKANVFREQQQADKIILKNNEVTYRVVLDITILPSTNDEIRKKYPNGIHKQWDFNSLPEAIAYHRTLNASANLPDPIEDRSEWRKSL